jgi:murein DD-endopeptidase MepM/ murein hydrolase activator NlpD
MTLIRVLKQLLTDMIGRHGELEGSVYAVYVHAKPIDGLTVSQKVKPGDPIARIIPLLHTRCYDSREHVHYELRVNNVRGRDINPHQFWVDGPGKVTCFKEGIVVPPGKTVAPVRCRTNRL